MTQIDSLYIKGTIDSPEVLLDKKKGIIMLSGRSLPENPKQFFNPIIDWITKYSQSGLVKTKVVFQFEYINSSSSKMLLELLDMIKEVFGKDNEDLLFVEWRYHEEDIDMLEAGEDFEDWVDLKFNFSSYK